MEFNQENLNNLNIKNDTLEGNGDSADAQIGANWLRNEEQTSAILNIPADATNYDMNHPKRGKCLIFNHEHFDKSELKPRLGTDVDRIKLSSCFGNMGFEVDIQKDLNATELIGVIKEVAKEDHSQSDCLVCCFLTHGEDNCLYAKDTSYLFDTVISSLAGTKCPTLIGKPKIFIVQACRGTKFDSGVQVRCREVPDSYKTYRIPVFADVLVIYSTYEGHYAFRNPERGSFFIKALCDNFNQYHKNIDLMSMLTFVNRDVAYEFESKTDAEFMDKKKQVPCVVHTLTRRVFFV